jgi:hypothetical protein
MVIIEDVMRRRMNVETNILYKSNTRKKRLFYRKTESGNSMYGSSVIPFNEREEDDCLHLIYNVKLILDKKKIYVD